jgi:hypothetical protein
MEGELDHSVGREQISQAVSISVQGQVTAPGQDVGRHGG